MMYVPVCREFLHDTYRILSRNCAQIFHRKQTYLGHVNVAHFLHTAIGMLDTKIPQVMQVKKRGAIKKIALCHVGGVIF